MIRTREEFPESGTSAYRILETDKPKTIFAHACEDDAGSAVLATHNLSDQAENVTNVLAVWDLPLWVRMNFATLRHHPGKIPIPKLANS
jgi:hypothetical protein